MLGSTLVDEYYTKNEKAHKALLVIYC